MKILLGLPEYPPHHIGGGGEVFKNLAENYRNLGHEVVVIYGYYPTKSWNENIKEFKKDGIKFYQIPEIPYPKTMPFLRTVMPPNPKSWFRLKSIIKKENPDVAHLHGYGFVLIDKIAKILKKLKKPYLYTLHGAPVSPAKMKGILMPSYFFYKNLSGNYTLRNAKRITAVSKYSTTFLEFKKYKEEIIVVNNGIELSIYKQPKRNDNPYFNHISKNKKDIIVLSLGRIEWLKGFQFFIGIIPDLLNKGYNIKYFIAGNDNGYKKELDELIEKFGIRGNVFYLGYLDFKSKLSALYYCDFVIIPSLVENFPAVPLEAMALGKIPIVNNIGGMKEIIRDNINGVIVDVNRKDLFEEKLIKIFKNKNLKRYIKRNLKNVNRYNWEKIAKLYLNLLTK
jgi:glycosyltransferase involved in cell wall biosynthesis